MNNTVKKIKQLSKDVANKKLAEQQQEIQKRIDADTKVIDDILRLVGDRLIYKESEKQHSRRKTFLVVTEETVLEDYTNPPEYGSGTSIKWNEGGFYSYPHTEIRVNGHRYYHAADLITRYEFDAKKAMDRAEKELEYAKERKQSLEDMEDLEPLMKELMLNYQNTLGKYQLTEKQG